MSRVTWEQIKHAKNFYVSIYRKAGTVLLLSLLCNVLLAVFIHYFYFAKPARHFYASDGITPPVELTPMDQPNDTSVPLLAADQGTPNEVKVIPQ